MNLTSKIFFDKHTYEIVIEQYYMDRYKRSVCFGIYSNGQSIGACHNELLKTCNEIKSLPKEQKVKLNKLLNDPEFLHWLKETSIDDGLVQNYSFDQLIKYLETFTN